MTKRIKGWWKTFSFWDKIRMILGSVGIGGEITLFLVEAYPEWKIVAAISTIISIFITYFFKDSDNDGVVDILE